jgi:glutamine synthetase
MSLPQPDSAIQAEYIWIGGSGQDLRSKTRTLDREYKSAEDLPVWNYDGSSTGQASGKDSEVYLKPVALYKDPFRLGKNILVMCEAVMPDGRLTPHATNTRRRCYDIMSKAASAHPWFGLEQEYTLFEADGTTPLGWPKFGFPGPQGPYYCA